eukprot:TRINITY_DN2811_c0_g1_i1.p1 TRINITY_DN2811_c0_g1~~TRINITY_DN2811_c0_g1_i1.p1  ORF type:complete len:472 (+),score=41.11 TRINITY_DN2811_c0_g1_i1:444-1859(+)
MSASLRTVSKFLSAAEIKTLIEDADLITTKGAWTEGRQQTKYFKHSLRSSSLIPLDRHNQLIERSLRGLLPSSFVNQNLKTFKGENCSLQIPDSLEWDCYLIKYPVGSRIPFHTDPLPVTEGQEPRVHRRLNAIVKSAQRGGSFCFKLDENKVDSQNPAEGDAIIFSPSHTEHSVSEIEDGERLVWSVGCVLSANDLGHELQNVAKRHAMIIGAGEVGRQLYRGLSNSGWTCEFIRRHDTEGWSRATQFDANASEINLRILAMREEDLSDALTRFDGFPHRSKLVLVQNGFLEAILEPKLLEGVTRGLIYFTSKADFFSQLTDSLFWGPYGGVIADSLNKGGILAREISAQDEFTQHMVIKGIWNSLVGLPLHVHKISLGEYVDSQETEIKAIIKESINVTRIKYGAQLQLDTEDIWNLFKETTKNLRWMKRSGKAAGLAARNAAIQKWATELGIPTPDTDRLLQMNSKIN